MEKQIITGVLSILLLFLLLAFAGAAMMDSNYGYNYGNSYDRNLVVYDYSEKDYDSDDMKTEKNTVYYFNDVNVDSDYKKQVDNKGNCYEPLKQVRERHCYMRLPQIRSSCEKRNGGRNCYSDDYYGRYYNSYYMNEPSYNCYN